MDDELRENIRNLAENFSIAVENRHPAEANQCIDGIMEAVAAECQKARKVGQYQAAHKLYGDVCNIYMFGDNQSSAKAKSIAEWSAVGLVKDCEAFMNDNQAEYKEYLTALKPADDTAGKGKKK